MKVVVTPFDSRMRNFLKVMSGGRDVETLIMEGGVATLGQLIAQRWIKLLDNVSHKGWASKYAKSINVVRSGPAALTIMASGMFTNFVENGIERWDMTKTIPPGKDFRIVAFQHFNPKALQRAAMPPEVYERVRGLAKGKSLKGIPMKAAEVAKGYTASIYEGMKKFGAAGHSQYKTFRVMRRREDLVKQGKEKGGDIGQAITSKWFYPKIEKEPVFPKIVREVPGLANKAFAQVTLDVANHFKAMIRATQQKGA